MRAYCLGTLLGGIGLLVISPARAEEAPGGFGPIITALNLNAGKDAYAVAGRKYGCDILCDDYAIMVLSWPTWEKTTKECRRVARKLTKQPAIIVMRGQRFAVGDMNWYIAAAREQRITLGFFNADEQKLAGVLTIPGYLNINEATQTELEALPKLGEKTAKSILEWRRKHGNFTSIYQLRDVAGIGPVKFEYLFKHVRVQ